MIGRCRHVLCSTAHSYKRRTSWRRQRLTKHNYACHAGDIFPNDEVLTGRPLPYVLGRGPAARHLPGAVVGLARGGAGSRICGFRKRCVETSTPPVAIQSIYAGRISKNELNLGRKVKRGEVLVALDANLQQLQLKEEESQGGSIRAQIGQLRGQILAEQSTMEEEERAARIGLDESRARVRKHPLRSPTAPRK